MLIVYAHNLTGTKEDGTSDYAVEVNVNKSRIIFQGQVKNHIRAAGASVLLRLIADEMDKEIRHANRRR